ncbi:hypothetical protein OBV_p-00160 (plasmid) [Oscillibacter valericigenes Sjm18-20]|nr:hypothetical protein OBV_p-00160 [Oscillibacter valericigenes Sjm18-20]
MNTWQESCVHFKDDRVIVKLREVNGDFKKSIVIPTAYYPVDGHYEVFTEQNTKQIKSADILKVIDSVPYKIGFCYENTRRIVEAVSKIGKQAVPYVGWLFTNDNQFPVHHCWAVLDGCSVIDLADDFSAMLSGSNGENFKKVRGDDLRELIADFTVAARKKPNSVRCYPIGTPTSFLLYVGSPCTPEKGRTIYNDLIKTYPDHECQRNCGSSGLNATQRILARRGLMKL